MLERVAILSLFAVNEYSTLLTQRIAVLSAGRIKYGKEHQNGVFNMVAYLFLPLCSCNTKQSNSTDIHREVLFPVTRCLETDFIQFIANLVLWGYTYRDWDSWQLIIGAMDRCRHVCQLYADWLATCLFFNAAPLFPELLRWVYFATCEKGPGACHNDGNKRMHPELWGGRERHSESERVRGG